MTKIEMLEIAIKEYKGAIQLIDDGISYDALESYLFDKYMNSGLCSFFNNVFGYNISSWIKKYGGSNNEYIHRTPGRCFSYIAKQEALQVRLEVLKKELIFETKFYHLNNKQL